MRLKIFHKRITAEKSLLIVANLLPVYGVWFAGWPAVEVFYVYIFESVIAGLLTLTKMTITGSIKREDTWENNGRKTLQPFWLFLFFFFIHYGFFITIQLFMFLKVIPGKEIGLFDFVTHYFSYISLNGLIMLCLFTIGYAYKNLYGFVVSGAYRSASLMALMFEPYSRIFIQQFTVILGSFFLLFNGGKLFILVFSFARIVFEVLLDYERRIQLMLRRNQERSNSRS